MKTLFYLLSLDTIGLRESDQGFHEQEIGDFMLSWTSFIIGFVSGGCATGCFILLSLLGYAIQQQAAQKKGGV